MAKAESSKKEKKGAKRKEKRNVPHGVAHIQATFNNTIVTITDPLGNVLSWSSAGSLGFRGSRKGTPFAAQQASLTASQKAKDSGVRTCEVRVAGPRQERVGREHGEARRRGGARQVYPSGVGHLDVNRLVATRS